MIVGHRSLPIQELVLGGIERLATNNKEPAEQRHDDLSGTVAGTAVSWCTPCVALDSSCAPQCTCLAVAALPGALLCGVWAACWAKPSGHPDHDASKLQLLPFCCLAGASVNVKARWLQPVLALSAGSVNAHMTASKAGTTSYKKLCVSCQQVLEIRDFAKLQSLLSCRLGPPRL